MIDDIITCENNFNLTCKVFLAKMVHLSERIELLMMICYGDKRRSFAQVVILSNEIHFEPFSKSTV